MNCLESAIKNPNVKILLAYLVVNRALIQTERGSHGQADDSNGLGGPMPNQTLHRPAKDHAKWEDDEKGPSRKYNVEWNAQINIRFHIANLAGTGRLSQVDTSWDCSVSESVDHVYGEIAIVAVATHHGARRSREKGLIRAQGIYPRLCRICDIDRASCPFSTILTARVDDVCIIRNARPG